MSHREYPTDDHVDAAREEMGRSPHAGLGRICRIEYTPTDAGSYSVRVMDADGRFVEHVGVFVGHRGAVKWAELNGITVVR